MAAMRADRLLSLLLLLQNRGRMTAPELAAELEVSVRTVYRDIEALGASGHKGALVALDVKTGGVLAMASNPSYDPNGLGNQATFNRLNRDEENAPLLNRATQNGYPPGSTMKVVTAAAALDTGRYRPDSRVSGENGKVISGVPLNNFGSESFGDVDLTFALTNSIF